MPEGTNEAGKGTEVQSGAGGTPDPKAGAATPPAGAGEPAKKPEEPKKGEPAKKPEEGAGAKGGEGKQPKQIGEDDELPEDSELVSMSKQALTKRLDRHTKKELRERFGTDDYSKIKSDLDELADFRAKKEETRKAALSKEQKLEEEKRLAEKRADDLAAELEKERNQQVFAEYDATAKEVFADKIAPKHMKRAVRELKEHILSMDEDEAPKEPKKAKKAFEKWTKEWLEENPEFAKAAPEEPKKIALTTGSNPNARREKGDAELAHKTAKPGQANSMSKAEYAAFKRERGLS